MQTFRLWILSSSLLASALWARPSTANEIHCGDDSNYRQLAQAGYIQYQKKQYLQALDLFECAYKQQPAPELLINIGRTLFRLNRFQESIGPLQEFLRLRPGSTLESQILAFIDESRHRLVESLPEKSPPKRSTTNNDTMELLKVPTMPVLDSDAPPTQNRLLIAGGVIAGLGLIALLAGFGFYETKHQVADQLWRSTDEFEKLGYIEEASHFDRGSLGGYITGAVLLGTGTILFGYGVYQTVHNNKAERRMLKTPAPYGSLASD